MKKTRPPVHPGEILDRQFIRPLGLSYYELAKALKVQQTRISQIVNTKRGISADTALRLARYFGTSSQFWMNLQSRYELELAQDAVGESIKKRVQPRESAQPG